MGSKKVAVIGLRHGARHVQGFLDAGASQIYAVDLNPSLAEQFTDPRVKFSSEYEKVIENVDLIVISLPPALHKQALIAALSTNAERIWIEKPLFDIGEISEIHDDSGRVEVIYELRRSHLLAQELNDKVSPEEMWLTWQRPVPETYNPKPHPIGVIHDLGSHLIDFAFVLSQGAYIPEIQYVKGSFSPNLGTQKVGFNLKFGDILAHISVGWVGPGEWPDEEIVVKQAFGSGTSKTWYGMKAAHRHLTMGEEKSPEQMQDEKNWYGAAISDGATRFATLAEAKSVHVVCNTLLTILQEKEKL